MSVGNYASFLYNALGDIGESYKTGRNQEAGLAAVDHIGSGLNPYTPISPAVTQATNVTPQGAQKQAYDYFVSQGYKPHQAAGLVGNLMAESNLNTGAVSKADGRDGSDSIGIAQWNGPRAAAFNQYATANKLNPSDINAQLGFINQELNTTEKAAGDRLRSSQDVNQATAAAVGYERPAGYTQQNPQGAIAFDKRLAYAQQLNPQNTQVASLDPSVGLPETSQVPAPQGVQTAQNGALNGTYRPPQQISNVAPDDLKALLRSETTRPLGLALLQQRLQGKNAGFEVINDPNDGTIYQRNLSTGETSVLRDGTKDGKPTFGVIREDEYGNKTYGFIDAKGQKVTPYTSTDTPQPATDVEDPRIRPAPPGADKKAWRKTETERLAKEGDLSTATESQAAANIYASRMENSNEILNRLENQGLSRTNKIKEGLPFGNNFTPKEYQSFAQARDDFLRAVLRKESGATISPSELEGGYSQYFPVAGDKPEIVSQKRKNREVALKAIRDSSGPFRFQERPKTGQDNLSGNGFKIIGVSSSK